MSELTQEHLKSILHYCPNTGIFTRLKTASPTAVKGATAGCLNKYTGYLQIKIDGISYRAHRLAWFYVYGVWPSYQIDHKDHVRSHNWIGNLRDVTNTENHKNQKKNKNNSSGVTGVHWAENVKKWQAMIGVGGKQKNLGYFCNIDEAVKARERANKKYGFHQNHGT